MSLKLLFIVFLLSNNNFSYLLATGKVFKSEVFKLQVIKQHIKTDCKIILYEF